MSKFEQSILCAEIRLKVQLSLQDQPVVLIDTVREDFTAIRVDRKRIRHVLVNLLSNALKFQERRHIRIEAELSDD